MGSDMCRGTVKWFDKIRGYGFITSDAGGGEMLVQASTLEASGLKGLVEGQRVEYSTDRSGPRIVIVDLRLID